MGDQWIGDATEYLCVGTFFPFCCQGNASRRHYRIKGQRSGEKNRQLLVHPECVCRGVVARTRGGALFPTYIFSENYSHFLAKKYGATFTTLYSGENDVRCRASNFKRRGGFFLSPDRKLSHDDFSRFLDMAVKMRSFCKPKGFCLKSWKMRDDIKVLFFVLSGMQCTKMFRRQTKRLAGTAHIFDKKIFLSSSVSSIKIINLISLFF